MFSGLLGGSKASYLEKVHLLALRTMDVNVSGRLNQLKG